MSLNLEPRQYGACRVRATHNVNLDRILKKLLRRRPDASDQALARTFLKSASQEELEALACYWVSNRRNKVEPYREEDEEPLEARIVRSHARAEEKKKAVAKTKAAAAAVGQKILMNLEMPNGKALGDCTGSDDERLAKGFTKLSKLVNPKEKNSKLGEAKVRSAFK